MWHRLMHILKPSLWVTIERIPGYPKIYRQRCRECSVTRLREAR